VAASRTESRNRATTPLTTATLYVLLSLADGERHGYAIAREIESISKGTVRMGPGTLYGTLQRLVAGGFVEPAPAPRHGRDDPRRRYYRLTSRGRSALEVEVHRLAAVLAVARRRHLLDTTRPEPA